MLITAWTLYGKEKEEGKSKHDIAKFKCCSLVPHLKTAEACSLSPACQVLKYLYENVFE